ncbi:FMN-binding protein [Pseudoduganella danionis]|uniref:FMN-binding protein n=2 Tax=Telluria group TaxID=2895353 RepID=A0A845I389_9BURK|nr:MULTISPECIES: FMN-binding protein [Telluria group]MTW35382.1 FMN-binding protein [Pseudoduganella danionis]MYN47672.1 FMN-binding protein [Duganella fentianensis]
MRYRLCLPLAASLACLPAYAVQYLSVEQVQKLAYPDATAYRTQDVALSLAQMQQVEKLAGLPARSVNWHVIGAYNGDKLLGYLVLDDVIGKFELISYAVALNPDASIRQVEILTYRESHGGEIRLPAWRRQFTGKSASTGGLTLGGGIAGISGATLSASHLTDGVRRIAAIAQVVLRP